MLAQLAPARARAQDVEDLLPLTDDPTDPIGIDREPVQVPDAAQSGTTSIMGKAARADFGPEPPPLTAQAGEVVTAPGGVHERSHHVAVDLEAGLATVHVELTFENAGEKPAEVAYRLAVPEDAALYAFEVCNEHGCRAGLPDPSRARLNAYDDAVQARPTGVSRGLPAADAHIDSDARGNALWLRAAPVTHQQTLLVRAAYVAQASFHDGVARLRLPARGMDARAAVTSLNVRAAGYTDVRANERPMLADAQLPLDAWSPIELRARSTSSGIRAHTWSVRCGKLHCVRAFATASADKPAPVEMFLAIDASPSTEGEARSRLLGTVAALLARAPQGSHVRALRFASKTAPLVSEPKPARELPLSAFAPIAFEAELGAATRFETAWKAIERSGFAQTPGRKLVVILGDGGLTTGAATPFAAAKRAGVEVAVVNVADRPSVPALRHGAAITGGAVIDAGREADAAARGASPEPLEERLAALFQPIRGVLRIPGKRAVNIELRAGNSVVWEAAVATVPALRFGAHALPWSRTPNELAQAIAAHVARGSSGLRDRGLVAVDRADLRQHAADRPPSQAAPARRGTACDRRGPARRVSGLSSDDAPVLQAQERAVCALAKSKSDPATAKRDLELGVGMPGSPLLSMLRQRIIPVARGCFRRDRAGRLDYQVRAVFVFELADNEVVSASVQGKIDQALRDCLLTAVDSLAVPRFTGRVVVRYPLVTEREPLPSQIELMPETAKEIDRLTGP